VVQGTVGCVDGRVDGCVEGFVDGCVDGFVDIFVDGFVVGVGDVGFEDVCVDTDDVGLVVGVVDCEGVEALEVE